jgi:hypothetical protein
MTGPASMTPIRAVRFDAHLSTDSAGQAVIAVPLDPDKTWGAKAFIRWAGRSVRQPERPPAAGGCAAGARPTELRAEPIAEVMELLAHGVKERPRP